MSLTVNGSAATFFTPLDHSIEDLKNQFVKAVIDGDFRLVQDLVSRGVNPNDTFNQLNGTPLHLVMLFPRWGTDVLRFLIQCGLNIEAVDRKGQRPIHLACMTHDLNKLNLLLEAGADVHAKVSKEVGDYLDDWIDGDTALHLALKDGAIEERLQVAQRLLCAGANLNAVNENGETPLFKACCSNQIEVVHFLLKAGADVTISTTLHQTSPLHIASMKGYLEIVNLLLASEAQINQKDAIGTTPLFRAVQFGQLEVVRFLLKKGADVHVRDNLGQTAIGFAASCLCLDSTGRRVDLKMKAKRVGQAVAEVFSHDPRAFCDS